MDKAFQDFQEHLQTRVLHNIESRMKNHVLEMEKNCFESSQNNPERFANCMYDKAKLTQDQMQKFEIKLEFYAKHLMKCVEQQSDESGREACLLNVKNSVKMMADETFDKL